MPNPPPCRDDDTKVIYKDKLQEVLHEIETADLSKDDLDVVEQKVVKIKNRMNSETKQRTKKDENRSDPDRPLLAGGV